MRALAASAALVLLVLLTTAGQFAGRPVSVPLPGESSPPDTASSTTWMNPADGLVWRYWSTAGVWVDPGFDMWFNLPTTNASGFMKFGSNTVSDTTTATAAGWWFPDSMLISHVSFDARAGSATDGCSALLYTNRNAGGPNFLSGFTLTSATYDAKDSTLTVFTPDSSRFSLAIPAVGTPPDYPMFKYRIHKFVRP